MSFDFSADEVFEMAEQLEKNGADFYRASAASITDEENKKVLLGLAAMEDEHGKIFAGMRASLTAGDKESNTFDPEEETLAYLKALVALVTPLCGVTSPPALCAKNVAQSS